MRDIQYLLTVYQQNKRATSYYADCPPDTDSNIKKRLMRLLQISLSISQLLLSAKTSSLACTCMHAHASLEK